MRIIPSPYHSCEAECVVLLDPTDNDAEEVIRIAHVGRATTDDDGQRVVWVVFSEDLPPVRVYDFTEKALRTYLKEGNQD